MSLSVMFDQIQRPSWWGLPAVSQPMDKASRGKNEMTPHKKKMVVLSVREKSVHSDKLRAEIIEFIKEQERPVRLPEIGNALEFNFESLRYHLKDMVNQQKLIKITMNAGRRVLYWTPDKEAAASEMYKGKAHVDNIQSALTGRAKEAFGNDAITADQFADRMGYEHKASAHNTIMRLRNYGLVKVVEVLKTKYSATFVYQWCGK